MARRLRVTPRASTGEIDNVIEHDAGLRSLSDASRMLRMEPAEVVALIKRGAFPDAYQVDGHWRIPVYDIRRVLVEVGTGRRSEGGVGTTPQDHGIEAGADCAPHDRAADGPGDC